jgi:serine protease Do
MAEALDLDRPVGALVNDVTDGSAAEKAGIEPGDVILEFDGEPIETWGDLPPLVGANPPGTRAEVLVSRNGKERTFEVTLDALQTDEEGNVLASAEQGASSNALGLAVESIGPEQRRSLGDPEGGVLVASVESDAAYRAGLRAGDVVLTINNSAVEGVESFNDIVGSLEPWKAVALRVMRDGITRYIAFTPAVED